MVSCKKGRTEIRGKGIELLADISCIVYEVKMAMAQKVGEELAVDMITEALRVGLEENLEPKVNDTFSNMINLKLFRRE